MKFLSMFLIFVFLLSCSTIAQEKKHPLEGTWEQISAKWTSPDTTTFNLATDNERNLLVFSRTHTMWIYQDTSQTDGYGFGGGKYTLEGENYTEYLEIYYDPKMIGKSVNYTWKVKGDTLKVSGIHPYKKWGLGEYDLQLDEVYKRID